MDTGGRRFCSTLCIKSSDFQRNRSMSRIFWGGNATSELSATTTMTNVAKLDRNGIITLQMYSVRSSFQSIAIVGITYRESHKMSIDGEVPWKSRTRGKQKQIPSLPWLGLYYYSPLLSANELVGNHSVTLRLSTKCTRSKGYQ